MKAKLELKAKAKLSAQQMQSLSILQMNIDELREEVRKQVEENPALESENLPHESLELFRKKLNWLNNRPAYENERYVSGEEDDFKKDIPVYRANVPSLYEYLLSQLSDMELPYTYQKNVKSVLEYLEESGRLNEPQDTLLAETGMSSTEFEAALSIVQSLEPAGVGARSLIECLLLQAQRQQLGTLCEELIKNDLEDLARWRIGKVAQKHHCSEDDVAAAYGQIRMLDPKPCLPFESFSTPAYVIPDLEVVDDGKELQVQQTNTFLPTLTISNYYVTLLNRSEEPELVEYLTERIASARKLISNISQRNKTIISCMEQIARIQAPFFRESAPLRPMTLADVATAMGVHESTVSRAVRGKYVQCPHGVYAMESLFSRQFPAGKSELSVDAIKKKLSDLLEQENHAKPYSDQKLCDLLTKDNIVIARRTVAKYREELGYPSASQRKK